MLLPPNARPPREERPQSPQLTLRIAVLGGLAVVLFTVLFFRLWVLQVLSSESYAQEATQNQLRSVSVQAPRGNILDRSGTVLVANRPADAVTMDPALMPNVARACGATHAPVGPPVLPEAPDLKPPGTTRNPPRQRRINARLARRYRTAVRRAKAGNRRLKAFARRQWTACIDPCRDPSFAPARPGPAGRSACLGEGTVLRRLLRFTARDRSTRSTPADFGRAVKSALIRSPFEPVTLIDDAPLELVVFLKEHGTAFPGLHVSARNVRAYQVGKAGGQLYGQLVEASQQQLADAATYPDLTSGDLVGSGGVEGAYDRWLRGRDGRLNLRVDAQSRPQGVASVKPAAVPGHDLRLTIDENLQAAAVKALSHAFTLARAGSANAERGAIVAMDPRNGEIRAMVSWPSYNPNILVGKDAVRNYERLQSDLDATPMVNRAADGRYPAGSTFKPVTAIAAGQSGLLHPDDLIACEPKIEVLGTTYHNFDANVSGTMALPEALTRSCDTWFYHLGERLYADTSRNGSREPQAQWGHRLGFGRSTGFDLGDDPGVMPDAAYKDELARAIYLRNLHDRRGYLIHNRWTPGDAILTAIGQGDTQVTPLQIASLYALVANGGTLVTPHVAMDVKGRDGGVMHRFSFPPRRRIAVDPTLLARIRQGLFGATHDGLNGTAASAFAGFPVSVAGKTGTAQKGNQKDYAWFAGYAPYDDPQLVVVAVIEQGGFGGEVAAPAVRDVMAAAFRVPTTKGSEAPRPRDLDGRIIPEDPVQMANGKALGLENGVTPAKVAEDAAARERARAAAALAATPTAPTVTSGGHP